MRLLRKGAAGFLEAPVCFWLSVILSLLLKFPGCANRGLMAQNGSPQSQGGTLPTQSGKLGETSGGADFLIAGTGGGFNVPIRKTALAWQKTAFRETPD